MENYNELENILQEELPKSSKLAKILNYIMEFCEVPKEAYIILGSYAIRDYREISDLDVDMCQNYFPNLESCKLGNVSLRGLEYVWAFNQIYNGESYIIEVYSTDPFINFPNNYFSIANLINVNALQKDMFNQNYYKLETLLKWKEIVYREKDKKDIELIKKILNLN